MRILSKILAVVVFGVIGILAISPLAGALVSDGHSNIVFGVFMLVLLVLVAMAPSGRRAWGRASLVVGCLFLALPLSVTLLSARAGSEVVASASQTEAAAATVGAAIGGGLMVGASMFLGFILGAIFLVMGLVLVLGGRREVIVVKG